MTSRRLSLTEKNARAISRACSVMDQAEVDELHAMPPDVLRAVIVCATWIVDVWIPQQKLQDAAYQTARARYDPQGARHPAHEREFREAAFSYDERRLRVGRRRALARLLIERARLATIATTTTEDTSHTTETGDMQHG